MFSIRMKAIVGEDGELSVHMPMGMEAAGREVLVTIEATQESSDEESARQREWHQILNETYGSCAGMGLERPDQGVPEERDQIE